VSQFGAEKFTTRSREAIEAAQLSATTAGNTQTEPIHLLVALLQQDVHLAALELGREQGAQRRLLGAQLLGQAKRQVQETAVDRADFQAQAAPGDRAFAPGSRRVELGAGVTGHAVNCHGTLRW